jgi:hypothetical protein
MIEPFEKAKELLRTKPLPKDIIKQLDELREDVPADRLEDFDWYYEAAMVAEGD